MVVSFIPANQTLNGTIGMRLRGWLDLEILKVDTCGRFANCLTWREIVTLYRLSVPAERERNLPARYCSTTTIDTVIKRNGSRDLVPVYYWTSCSDVG